MAKDEKLICMVCGKSSERMISNKKYPDKHICLSCFNGFAFSIKTLEEELEPFIDDLTSRLDSLDKKSGNAQE